MYTGVIHDFRRIIVYYLLTFHCLSFDMGVVCRHSDAAIMNLERFRKIDNLFVKQVLILVVYENAK